eukprot:TRINITY_DN3182_c0_g2_i2.p1 TRINITY_DN3182_c0_g2~~TRINITY_DN3182_c0_g2_i2.p1  ORF type:complete len:597 (+),score=177.83 TRINITY_DN3182_c0_g2_i2:49-1791(+)
MCIRDRYMGMNVFIKNYKGEPLLGKVWPGLSHFPDFLHPNATEYWSNMFVLLAGKLNFDGIWLDMNEISNFCDGECPPEEVNKIVIGQPDSMKENAPKEKEKETTPKRLLMEQGPRRLLGTKDEDLPYHIGNGKLDDHLVQLNATHAGGLEDFNAHHLNTFYENAITYGILQQTLNMSDFFILTRANMPGIGRFAAHWGGDNYADWGFYRRSLSQIFNYQIFGIPMMGVDICGFAGNTTEGLCARWMQLGSLYPFSRNHNAIDSIDQEPFALGPTVLETSRKALQLRYSLLKFYYSIFVLNNGTGSVFRPLIFNYPDDQTILDDGHVERLFMIGNSLLVVPAQDEAGQVVVYFPQDTWYNLSDGSLVRSAKTKAGIVNMVVPLNASMPVFLRGGHIVALQNSTNVRRAKDLGNVFQLTAGLVTLNKSTAQAKGNLLLLNDYSLPNVRSRCQGAVSCQLEVTIQYIQGRGYADVVLNFAGVGPQPADPSKDELIALSRVTLLFDRSTALNFARIKRYETTFNNNTAPTSPFLVDYKIKQNLAGNSVIDLDINPLYIRRNLSVTIRFHYQSVFSLKREKLLF